MSLFEHWMKSAVWFCHTKTGWVVSSSLPSKTKLLLQKTFFLFCHFLFVLPMTFLLVCCSVTPCLNPPPHPTDPLFSSCLVSCCKKRGWLTTSEPLGRLAQSHDRADALLQSGAAATTGLCDAEERRGLLCSAEWVSRECDKSLLCT